jgi:signal transduction histidine kinase
MSRALKIVSRRRHPDPATSEELPTGGISMKISPAGADTWVTREARFNLIPSVVPSSAPKSLSSDLNLPSTSSPQEGETRCRIEESSRQIQKKEKEERIVLETINKLMVTISHYLNNPLTVLLGRVELLAEAGQNGGKLKGEIEKFAESCKREIYKMESIIKVFQNLCEVRYKTYPPGVKMLDVEKEIKNRLKEVESSDMVGAKGR